MTLPSPVTTASRNERSSGPARREAVLTEYSPYLLDRDLAQMLWQGRDHVGIAELAVDYSRCCNLRRFSDDGVLREAIATAVTSKQHFAYADGYDEGAECYLGLVLGERPIVSMHEGLVVQREKALEQMAFDRSRDGDGDGSGAGGGSGADGKADADGNDNNGGNTGDKGGGNGGDVVPPKPLPREVDLEVQLDKLTVGYQVGSIVEEILQQLYDLGGASTELTFSAYVNVPDGIDEQAQRVIKENANALGVTIRVR